MRRPAGFGQFRFGRLPIGSPTSALTYRNVVQITTSGPLGTAFKPSLDSGNPCGTGSQPVEGPHEGSGTARNKGSDDPAESPREEKGRLSNPTQRRLSPADTDELIAAYRSGVTINELADRHGIHRSTVAAALDRHHVERHHAQTARTSETLADAAELYASGLSLAAVAARYGIDPQTVGNRFRRAGIPVRARRGWPPQRRKADETLRSE